MRRTAVTTDAATVSLIEDKGRFTLTLVGDFDESTTAPLVSAGGLIRRCTAPHVVVEAHDVDFASPSLLTALDDLRTIVEERGGSLRISSASPEVARLLPLAELDVLLAVSTA